VTSGVGQGTVVTQASATSGARLQARLAIEHGKKAFLLRSLLDEYDWAEDFAGKDGAVVVAEVDEVFAYLRESTALAEERERRGGEVVAGNAEPPVYVQRRMSRVAARGQQQHTEGGKPPKGDGASARLDVGARSAQPSSGCA
jgi:predicted Rossmann fold nucleotide-binding protein DprA/Smf involved in DNA uptake